MTQTIPKINPSVAELRRLPSVAPTAPVLVSPAERATFWQQRGIDVVYAIQGEPHTPVKIGKAFDVAARLRSLQTGSFMVLRLLDVIPGGYGVESRIHRALAGDRLQGEWFRGQATHRFLLGLSDYATEAIRCFAEDGYIPELPSAMLPPAAKRKRSSGMKSSDFGSNSLGHRWRTQTGENAPVKVSFVDPAEFGKPAA